MSNPKVDSIVSGFLEYLKKERQLNLLPEILRKLKTKMGESFVTADVTSSEILSKSQSEKILKILNSNFGIHEANFEVDTSLLGGIKVSIGDEVVDLSLRNKLNFISKSI